ncbi:HAMP domain-containing protein, partial [Rhodovastum atsumiense]
MPAVLTRSLMIRTVTPICALLAATIVMAVLGAVYVTTLDGRNALEDRVRLTAALLSGGAGDALWNLDANAARALLAPLGQDADYAGAILFDQDGRIFVRDSADAADRDGLIVRRVPIQRAEGSGKAEQIGILELHLATTRADAQVRQRAWTIVGIGSFVLLVVCGALALIVRGIIRPIVALDRTMGALANGIHDVRVPALGRADELGRMAATVEIFKANAIARLRLEAEAEQLKREAEIERGRSLRRVAEAFDGEIKTVLAAASGTAQAIGAASRSVADTATGNTRLIPTALNFDRCPGTLSDGLDGVWGSH